MNEADMIRISEIFGPTIQGEGALIGQPTVFVRTGGCDYRCSWCDTLYAVESQYRDQWRPMSEDQILTQIDGLSGNKPLMVTLSGGNPAIQPLGGLIRKGKEKGYRFALETQGSLAQDWFKDLDILTLSPKPPSSGMETNWNKLDECIQTAGSQPKTALKVVIFDDNDYRFAQDVQTRYPDLPLYLQPGNSDAGESFANQTALNARLDWIVGKTQKDQWYNITILPQLHVMLWGNEKGV